MSFRTDAAIDAALIDIRSASANVGAIEQEVLALFDTYRDRLLRYVCAFGIPIGDAEDVIQDVFLALFRHLGQGGARSNLHGWLFRVAHNLALKHRARHQRGDAAAASMRFAHGAIDHAPDPERALADVERQRRLQAVVRALPERDRHCVQLRSDGLRYREIARVLGMSLGAVAKSLTRTIHRLERADER
jgi:RNA polymerase sigma-70 factor (ECF subfamily)